jgi:hypothetical protein
MKTHFLLLIAFLGLNAFAQVPVNLPDLVIPSPQAFEITKYGNVPVDESSGRISTVIPIHTYRAGALEVPISLAYSGNGVKVEQKPTWTGINWILNAGGVITRMVRDLPDETSQPRYFYSLEELELLRQDVSGILKLSDNLSNALAGTYDAADSEADVFSFSFPGYSGSFFLKQDENGVIKARMVKYEQELKIEILGSFTTFGTYEFKITTPGGTSYFFGGNVDFPGTTEPGYATEETQSINRADGPSVYGKRAKTAFYLTKIENYLGDRIYLEYYTKDQQEVFLASNLSISAVLQTYGGVSGICPVLPDNDIEPRLIKNVVYNAKFLKRIWNPQTSQQVLFHSAEVENYVKGTYSLRFRALSEIDFGQGKASLEYLPTITALQNSNTREKFFLEKVTLQSSAGVQNQQYTMEYNDPLSLPQNTISNSQDYLGYYNGVSNPSLLPKNSMAYLQQHPAYGAVADIPNIGLANFASQNSLLGDRSTSFAHATKGILTKITYPTGGHTLFEYEPVEKDKYLYGSKSLLAYRNTGTTTPPRTPANNSPGYAGIGYEPVLVLGVTPDLTPVYISQDISVNLMVSLVNRDGVNSRDYVYMKVTDMAPGSTPVEKKWYFPNVSPYDFQTLFNTAFTFHLSKDNAYVFELGFGSGVGGIMNGSNPRVEASASFEYITGMDPNEGPGIRIKRVTDYTDNGADPTGIRRYYYKTLKSAMLNGEDSKIKTFKPQFHSFQVVNQICIDLLGNTAPKTSLLVNLNTNSFTQNLPSSDVLAIYPDVTVSMGGDNFEQGAIEKKFMIRNDDYQVNFLSPTSQPPYDLPLKTFKAYDDSKMTNWAAFNGTLLKEAEWRKKGTALEKIQQKEYTYAIGICDSINNIVGDKLYLSQLEDIPYNLYFGLYSLLSHKIANTSITTKEFVGGVPISAYTIPPFETPNGWASQDHDSDGIPNGEDPDFITPSQFWAMSDAQIEEPFKKIATQERIFYYPDVAGLPSETRKTGSDGAVVSTKYYYPTDPCVAALSGLSPTDTAAYSGLRAANRIESPIQTESYKGGTLLSARRETYTLNTSIGQYLLNKVKTKKTGQEFEDRITYTRYDQWGNPAELSLAYGTKVVYIWSRQRKLVYKITNASYDEVAGVLTGGIALNPEEYDLDNPMPAILTNPFITLLPRAQATIFNYNAITQLPRSVIDPKGDVINYYYDEFYRLKNVKDKNGNIINTYDYHYRTQN